MTREELKYVISSCGCFIYRGHIYYEETELMKAFEDLGLIHIGLEQQPCEDAISRQAVLDLCDKSTKYDIPFEYYEGKKHIRGWDIGRIINMNKLIELPSVKPQEKTGHWIDTDEGFSPCECSECKSVEFKRSKYCPNCGTRMVEEQESEDKE